MASFQDASFQDSARVVRLVFAGDHEELRSILTPDLARSRDPSLNLSSPLHVAVGENEETCVDVILEVCGEAVHCRDIEERTPLHHCGTLTSSATVQKLLSAGADVRARDRRQLTPLHYAVEAMAADAVEALLTGGADPSGLLDVARGLAKLDPDEEESQESALMSSNYLVAKSLGLRLGEDIDALDFDWDQNIVDLEDHDFQATLFSPPTSREKGARLRLTLAAVGDDDDDEDDEEQTLHEAVVDAELLGLNLDATLLRCFLIVTPPDLFELRPDLLLVKGRELLIRLSPDATAALPPL